HAPASSPATTSSTPAHACAADAPFATSPGTIPAVVRAARTSCDRSSTLPPLTTRTYVLHCPIRPTVSTPTPRPHQDAVVGPRPPPAAATHATANRPARTPRVREDDEVNGALVLRRARLVRFAGDGYEALSEHADDGVPELVDVAMADGIITAVG